MSHISQIDYATAPAENRAAFDEEVRLRGRTTAMKRTLMHSVPAYRSYMEWYTLRDELLGVLDDRAIWVFSHAISAANDCLICVTYFRKALIEAGFQPGEFQTTEEEDLLVEFGVAIAKNSNAVSDAIWQNLKVRYDEKALVDLVAFAGIMIATNIFNNVVGVELDADIEPFRKPEAAE